MRPLRILVAEDEPLISFMLVETLEEMGHLVCGSAWTEIDTVKAASSLKPDLMIVDARLRGGSGINAVQQILQSVFIPHIFASGDVLSYDAIDPRAIILQKPYRVTDLEIAIQRAFEPLSITPQDS